MSVCQFSKATLNNQNFTSSPPVWLFFGTVHCILTVSRDALGYQTNVLKEETLRVGLATTKANGKNNLTAHEARWADEPKSWIYIL